MGLEKIEINTDAKKLSKVGKQSKTEKKSATFEQRRAKYMPFVFTTLTLMGAKAVEATSVESSNQVKELADRMQRSYKSLAEGYVPSHQQIEQAERWYQEQMKNVPFYYGPKEAQGTSSEETSQPAENLSSSREARGIRLKKKVRLASSLDSRLKKVTPGEEISQSTMETHQGEQDKDKGKEPPSSNDKKIKIVQDMIEKVKTDPEAREHARKLLAERRQLKEQESRVPHKHIYSTKTAAQAIPWTEIWSDEFNGSANKGVDTTQWLYDTGHSYPKGATNWGTGEVEAMSNSASNVYQDGSGHLIIKPIFDGSTWTSGRIETQSARFMAPLGGRLAVEASIQLPPGITGNAAQGYWPAFWMLGAAFRDSYTNWPSIGEIDVMENINGQNTVHGTFHCGIDPGGPCHETTGLQGSTSCQPVSCQDGFHTYRVEIDRSTSPEEIRWYLDGAQYWQVSSNASGMDATTWANAVDHEFFIILNVAMGGQWPGNPTASTFSGAPMVVDYVRVYQSEKTIPTTNNSTIPIPNNTFPITSDCNTRSALTASILGLAASGLAFI
jgi:beta-glucanase (GH16 family)